MKMKTYRNDIDGLRAIAVICVILFHLGYLTNGYLGVDVFFTISGYLITSIIYKELQNDKFSIYNFYERRIRRILPLVIFSTIIAFILGVFFMLPDDLENLCQSIFATNISANNILMKITSADYWALKNDYKPLMHTWSLGVEEQFYIIYPFLFLFLKNNSKKIILLFLFLITSISLFFFLEGNDSSTKFYFLQYRFFELSFGGICALFFYEENSFKNYINNKYLLYIIVFMLFVVLFNDFKIKNEILIIITTILTSLILVFGKEQSNKNNIYKFIFSWSVLVKIGKISFSLYIWHQIVFAFSRYFLFEKINGFKALFLTIIVVLMSLISYYFIEKKFRDKERISTKKVYLILGLSFFIINCCALYVYFIGGIIRDVPELGLYKDIKNSQINFFNSKENIHIQYNEKVRELDLPFSNKLNNKNVKVLVIGNSFARDISNILLESKYNNKLEIRYLDLEKNNLYNEIKKRCIDSDFIFYSSDSLTKSEVLKKINKFDINFDKFYVFGTKDFGISNGFHYNSKIYDYKNYFTSMKPHINKQNTKFKNEWGNKYIDLISFISNKKGKVLVFTPEGKYISQDTWHLTKYGATYFAGLLDDTLKKIFEEKNIN
jgi:peptidoglycan/LPS O-acetylase OafA/YrhL